MAEDGPNWLRDRGYEVKYGRGTDAATLIEDLQDCDGVIPRLAVMSDEVIAACPRLKVIGRHGSGVDTIDLESCRRHGVRVINSAGSNATAVAEHTILLILACARNLNRLLRMYAGGHFSECRRDNRATEISGKTLGLLGYGHIGAKVAQMAHFGFGMRVLIYDPFIAPENIPTWSCQISDRDQLLRQSDFISIHLPANQHTNGSVGARELALMKSTCCLINTSRGTIVDTAALTEALKAGQIAGAGLDVSEPEPLDPAHELFCLHNVLLTPHIAGSTAEAKAASSLGAAMGCDEVLTGKPVTHPIV